MRTIKQPAGTKLCFAACVAMLTGETLEGVLAEVVLHEDGWLPLTQAIIYMARRKFGFGINIGLDPDSKSFDTFGIQYDCFSLPAVVTVRSAAFGGCNHAIVWDNERGLFRDPNPGYGELTLPNKYSFIDWMPVYRIPDNT